MPLSLLLLSWHLKFVLDWLGRAFCHGEAPEEIQLHVHPKLSSGRNIWRCQVTFSTRYGLVPFASLDELQRDEENIDRGVCFSA